MCTNVSAASRRSDTQHMPKWVVRAGIFISNFTSRLMVLSNQLSPKRHPTATLLMQVALASYALMVDHSHLDARGHTCPSWSHLTPLTSAALVDLEHECQLGLPHLLSVVSPRLAHAQRQLQSSQLSLQPSASTSQPLEMPAAVTLDASEPSIQLSSAHALSGLVLGYEPALLPFSMFPSGSGGNESVGGNSIESRLGTAESSSRQPQPTADHGGGVASINMERLTAVEEDALNASTHPPVPDQEHILHSPAVTESTATAGMSWLGDPSGAYSPPWLPESTPNDDQASEDGKDRL